MKIVNNDVFNFRYSSAYLTISKDSYPYHCFDGILVAKTLPSGDIILVDTYWSSGDSRSFSLSEANEKGILEYLCNLDDDVEICASQRLYYDDEDVIILPIHAGYRTRCFIKKGTVKSKTAMIKAINNRISEHNNMKLNAERAIKNCTEKLKEVEGGNLEVYIY